MSILGTPGAFGADDIFWLESLDFTDRGVPLEKSSFLED
jgi:hypothetical protein